MTRRYPFEIINLGESQTTSLETLIRLIEEALGKKVKMEFYPDQPGDVPITYADITKARELLDYDPITPVEEGIPRFIEWYLETKGGTK